MSIGSLVLAWLLSASLVAEVRSGIQQCEVTVPQGPYALVVLDFDVPDAPQGYGRWTYMGGMRSGVMPVDDGIGLRQPGGKLELRDGRLVGTFWRNNSRSTSSTSLVPVPPARVSLEAAVAGDEISGTVTIAGAEGKVTGRIIPETELARRNAVPRDTPWPAFLGPIGGGHASPATGQATIDEVEQIRLVWRCEEADIGQGIGSITRFMHTWKDATGRRTGSGSASPIAADGRIFLSYYVPAPRAAGAAELQNPTYPGTETELAVAMLEQARAAGFTGEELPEYAREKVYQSADDVVLCVDAATGKTLWKAVVRGRGLNIQHHKAGPYNMSPAYADGKLFALGMSGWLYAFDAASGKPLWEAESVADASAALTVCGGVVVAPAGNAWGGYDANTGKLLWTADSRGVAGLNRWEHAGREFLIGRMGPRHAPAGIACLDPQTGEALWRLPVHVLSDGRGAGPGGISICGDRLLVFQDNGTAAKNAEIQPVLAAYRLSPDKAEPLWQIGGGNADGHGLLGPTHRECVPVVVRNKFVFTADLRTIDLETGKVIDQAAGPVPRNGGYLQVIEDLVLVRVDGTHGGIRCGFYKVSPEGKIRPLTEAEWSPPFGGGTTSYHHPLFYPAVAGRLFLRQQDGLYCWDLRALSR